MSEIIYQSSLQDDKIQIERVTSVDDGLVLSISVLLAQLVSTPVDFSEKTLREIVNSTSSDIFLLYYNNVIIGMTTVGGYVSPTGRKLWIEDVVVDNNYRGKSLGKLLIEVILNYISSKANDGINTSVMLTSKPARVAANALYKSVGFEQKQTNVYKMIINN